MERKESEERWKEKWVIHVEGRGEKWSEDKEKNKKIGVKEMAVDGEKRE